MTRMSTSISNVNGEHLKRIAVVHHVDDQWHIAVAEKQNGAPPAITGFYAVSAKASSELVQTIERIEPDRILHILPGGSVICRTFGIPHLDEDHLAEAFDLQIEAELPETIPPHRQAGAFLQWDADSSDMRLAVAMGWPGNVGAGLPIDMRDRVIYSSEIACLLQLVSHATDHGFICYADRDHQTIELILNGPGGLLIRTVRCGGGDWADAVDAAVSETANSVLVPDDLIQQWRSIATNEAVSAKHAVIASESWKSSAGNSVQFARTVVGKKPDATLSAENLTCAAAIGAYGAFGQLFTLRDEPIEEPHSFALGVANRLNQPGRAVTVAIIALICFVVFPWAGAFGKYQIVKWKAGDINSQEQQSLQTKMRSEFFTRLDEKRLPMTKLLADVSGAAPYKLQINEVNIAQDRVVRVSGNAPSAEDYSTFEQALRNTGVFREFTLSRYETAGTKVEFELTFEIDDSQRRDEDTGRLFNTSLAQHLYGEDAEDGRPVKYLSSAPNSGLRQIGRSTNRNTASRNITNTTMESGTSSGVDTKTVPLFGGGDLGGAGGSGAVKPVDKNAVPDPITDEQLQKMTYTEIRAAWMVRARLKERRSLDEATRARLKDEFARLSARMKEIGRP